MDKFFKAMVDNHDVQIVICDLTHTIIYMNKMAIKDYAKRGGEKLIGTSLLDCHNSESQKKILNVFNWFLESENNNIIHTFYSEKSNADVYMVALRENGKLIGYYEKHEFRTKDNSPFYDFK